MRGNTRGETQEDIGEETQDTQDIRGHKRGETGGHWRGDIGGHSGDTGVHGRVHD